MQLDDTYQNLIMNAATSAIYSNQEQQNLAITARLNAELEALKTTQCLERIYHNERMRPFVMLRPSMSIDGNKWCALYGEDLQAGVAGFGDTPQEASVNFDIEWLNRKASA